MSNSINKPQDTPTSPNSKPAEEPKYSKQALKEELKKVFPNFQNKNSVQYEKSDNTDQDLKKNLEKIFNNNEKLVESSLNYIKRQDGAKDIGERIENIAKMRGLQFEVRNGELIYYAGQTVIRKVDLLNWKWLESNETCKSHYHEFESGSFTSPSFSHQYVNERPINIEGKVDYTSFNDRAREESWYKTYSNSAKTLLDIYDRKFLERKSLNEASYFDAKTSEWIATIETQLRDLASQTNFNASSIQQNFEKKHSSNLIFGPKGVYQILLAFNRVLTGLNLNANDLDKIDSLMGKGVGKISLSISQNPNSQKDRFVKIEVKNVDQTPTDKTPPTPPETPPTPPETPPTPPETPPTPPETPPTPPNTPPTPPETSPIPPLPYTPSTSATYSPKVETQPYQVLAGIEHFNQNFTPESGSNFFLERYRTGGVNAFISAFEALYQKNQQSAQTALETALNKISQDDPKKALEIMVKLAKETGQKTNEKAIAAFDEAIRNEPNQSNKKVIELMKIVALQDSAKKDGTTIDLKTIVEKIKEIESSNPPADGDYKKFLEDFKRNLKVQLHLGIANEIIETTLGGLESSFTDRAKDSTLFTRVGTSLEEAQELHDKEPEKFKEFMNGYLDTDTKVYMASKTALQVMRLLILYKYPEEKRNDSNNQIKNPIAWAMDQLKRQDLKITIPEGVTVDFESPYSKGKNIKLEREVDLNTLFYNKDIELRLFEEYQNGDEGVGEGVLGNHHAFMSKDENGGLRAASAKYFPEQFEQYLLERSGNTTLEKFQIQKIEYLIEIKRYEEASRLAVDLLGNKVPGVSDAELKAKQKEFHDKLYTKIYAQVKMHLQQKIPNFNIIDPKQQELINNIVNNALEKKAKLHLQVEHVKQLREQKVPVTPFESILIEKIADIHGFDWFDLDEENKDLAKNIAIMIGEILLVEAATMGAGKALSATIAATRLARLGALARLPLVNQYLHAGAFVMGQSALHGKIINPFSKKGQVDIGMTALTFGILGATSRMTGKLTDKIATKLPSFTKLGPAIEMGIAQPTVLTFVAKPLEDWAKVQLGTLTQDQVDAAKDPNVIREYVQNLGLVMGLHYGRRAGTAIAERFIMPKNQPSTKTGNQVGENQQLKSLVQEKIQQDKISDLFVDPTTNFFSPKKAAEVLEIAKNNFPQHYQKVVQEVIASTQGSTLSRLTTEFGVTNTNKVFDINFAELINNIKTTYQNHPEILKHYQQLMQGIFNNNLHPEQVQIFETTIKNNLESNLNQNKSQNSSIFEISEANLAKIFQFNPELFNQFVEFCNQNNLTLRSNNGNIEFYNKDKITDTNLQNNLATSIHELIFNCPAIRNVLPAEVFNGKVANLDPNATFAPELSPSPVVVNIDKGKFLKEDLNKFAEAHDQGRISDLLKGDDGKLSYLKTIILYFRLFVPGRLSPDKASAIQAKLVELLKAEMNSNPSTFRTKYEAAKQLFSEKFKEIKDQLSSSQQTSLDNSLLNQNIASAKARFDKGIETGKQTGDFKEALTTENGKLNMANLEILLTEAKTQGSALEPHLNKIIESLNTLLATNPNLKLEFNFDSSNNFFESPRYSSKSQVNDININKLKLHELSKSFSDSIQSLPQNSKERVDLTKLFVKQIKLDILEKAIEVNTNPNKQEIHLENFQSLPEHQEILSALQSETGTMIRLEISQSGDIIIKNHSM